MRERKKTTAAMMLPEGGDGAMLVFNMQSSSSVTGTVVPDKERTKAGVSVADKSTWNLEDSTLG